MAKSRQKIKAVQLRQKGESIREIAKKLKISKSSASIWCRDIILTYDQIQKLHDRMVTKSYAGRMKGARMQYERRLRRIQEAWENGVKIIGKLSERDLLIALIALYWGEGSKKTRVFAVSNSDPEMVKFIVEAIIRLWKVNKEEFIFRVGVNKIHKERDQEIKEYWRRITKSSIDQFRKTTFIKAKNKKKYLNFTTHYGTLTIKIRKSTNIYYNLMGLISAVGNGI